MARLPKVQERSDRMAYRGYLLVLNRYGEWNVSKDGFHIYATAFLDEAKHAVDQLMAF